MTLSADQYVALSLNLDRARMQQAHNAVVASDIASGRPGPLAYYELFSKSKTAAGEMRGEALLTDLMGSV